MKRFLSMVLTLALVLTTLVIPAAAEDAVVDNTVAVDITSIADGETFAAGSNVKLAADASTLEGVKNIDFFANGTKLPGTIVGNSGSITWYDLTEGVYDITTHVNYVSGTAEPGDETVRITVLPVATDLHMLWPGDYGITIPKTTESSEYAIYGKSAAITLPAGNTTLTVDLKATTKKGTGYTGILIYAPEAIEGVTIHDPSATSYTNNNATRMKLSTNGRTFNSSGGHQGIAKGFNKYVASGFGKDDTYFDKAYLRFYNVPENNTTPIYICGIYEFVNTTPVAPEASAVLDGKEAVCNEVGTFRIDLSGAIFPYATTTPVAVTKVEGETETEVEIKGYKLGSDYVDVYLNTLELESTYKVSVLENTLIGVDTANNYETKNTMVYVPAKTFTFSTKDTDCENATPVIKMSYPAADSTVLADTGFAAQLVSGSSAIDSVNFYRVDTVTDETEGTTSTVETLLGEGTAMTDGEYWFAPEEAALTAGAESQIIAKAVDADGTVLATASATYTGAATPSYFVKGIYDGAAVIKQHEAKRDITVVDMANAAFASSAATDIAKVEFYNGAADAAALELVTTDITAPYEYELVFGDFGTYKFEARIYDNFGGVHSKVSTYTVLDGVKNSSLSIGENFDSLVSVGDDATEEEKAALTTALDAVKTKLFSEVDSNITLSAADGALKLTSAASSKDAKFKVADLENSHKIHYYEFKIVSGGWANTYYANGLKLFDCGYRASNGVKHTSTTNEWTNAMIKVVCDYSSSDKPMITVFHKGEVLTHIDATGYAAGLKLRLGKNYSGVIDDFSYTVYDPRPEYAVKGIYDGATMVKEEEAARTITVVDKANANVVSTAATNVSKVEFIKDGGTAVTVESSPYAYTLTNDTYGEHTLKVNVYDIYGETHTFDYNYNVAEGVANAELSVDEDFDSLTTDEETAAAIKSVFSSVNTNITTTVVDGVLTMTGTAGGKYNTFNVASTDKMTGKRQLHYIEFDVVSAGVSGSFDMGYNKERLLSSFKENPYTGVENTTTTIGSEKPTIRIIYDYTNADKPVAMMYFNDVLWKVIEPASTTAPGLRIGVGNGYTAKIDNFKYTVYDYPSRFGKGVYEDTVAIDTTGRQQFTTCFTNTTDADVTVQYFVVTYEADGRQHFAYNTDSRLDSGDGLTTSWTVTYPAGSIDAENTFKLNIGEAGEGWSARIYGFVVDEDGAFDLTPISLYE